MIRINKKPEVGQIVYSLNVGNAARRRKQELTEMEVISVGRRYFKAVAVQFKKSSHMAIEFHINGWHEKTEYTSGYKLYEFPEDWEKDKEWAKIDNRLAGFFRYGAPKSTSLETMREFDAVLQASGWEG